MTGQTVKRVLIYISAVTCFFHGQLYVTFSRSSSFDNVTVVVVEGHGHSIDNVRFITSNIVYIYIYM
jgi:hypothetical protein